MIFKWFIRWGHKEELPNKRFPPTPSGFAYLVGRATEGETCIGTVKLSSTLRFYFFTSWPTLNQLLK